MLTRFRGVALSNQGHSTADGSVVSARALPIYNGSLDTGDESIGRLAGRFAAVRASVAGDGPRALTINDLQRALGPAFDPASDDWGSPTMDEFETHLRAQLRQIRLDGVDVVLRDDEPDPAKVSADKMAAFNAVTAKAFAEELPGVPVASFMGCTGAVHNPYCYLANPWDAPGPWDKLLHDARTLKASVDARAMLIPYVSTLGNANHVHAYRRDVLPRHLDGLYALAIAASCGVVALFDHDDAAAAEQAREQYARRRQRWLACTGGRAWTAVASMGVTPDYVRLSVYLDDGSTAGLVVWRHADDGPRTLLPRRMQIAAGKSPVTVELPEDDSCVGYSK